MKLYEGQKGSTLQVVHMDLPLQTERRLEVLGMLEGTRITVVNRKRKGAMIIKYGAPVLQWGRVLRSMLR